MILSSEEKQPGFFQENSPEFLPTSAISQYQDPNQENNLTIPPEVGEARFGSSLGIPFPADTCGGNRSGTESGYPHELLQHCGGCGEPIIDRYLLNVLDKTWHASCVRCVDCNLPLTEKCYSRDGRLFCRDDFFRLVQIVLKNCLISD